MAQPDPLMPLSAPSGDQVSFVFDEHSRQILADQAFYWQKRSKTIKALRLVLPGLIVLILLVIIGWITIQSLINALNIYKASGDDIRMTNPRFIGQTGSGEHYELSGLEAIRHGNNNPIINLKGPTMEMKGEASRANHIQAINGVYDDQAKTFSVHGRVTYLGGAQGFTLKTEQAKVDLIKNTVSGDGPVDGIWDKGRIHGESFTIYDNGTRLVFQGKGDKKVTAEFEGH